MNPDSPAQRSAAAPETSHPHPQPVVCITGMHRSGTSLTASWLQACGLQIDDGRLVGPAVGNVKGHFEDREFVDLHAAAFGGRRSRSRGWKVREASFRRFDDQARGKAQQMVAARNERFGQWGWKDPRSVVYLPDWVDLVPGLRVLFLWRPAGEVVDSLLRRSRSGRKTELRVRTGEAADLWCRYNELVLQHLAAHPDKSVLVRTGDVVSRNRDIFDSVTDRLGLALEYRPIETLFESGLLGRSGGKPLGEPRGRRADQIARIEHALERASA